MFNSLMDSSTIPVLEQVVQFTQARHGVLAGNIANLDTPGYRTRDLSQSDFQSRLKEAVETRRQAEISPSYQLNAEYAGRRSTDNYDGMDKVRESMKNILYHDDSDISIENQVAEINKNQSRHNLALSIMNAQFRMLRAAITERA